MAIGSLNSYLAMSQGYFSPNGTLLQQMTSLAEQKKNASQNVQSFLTSLSSSKPSPLNESLFDNLGKVNSAAADLRTQTAQMGSLNSFSSSVGKTASYTNESVLSADVAKNATVSNFTKTSVDVQQLATGQQNQGSALQADENAFGASFSVSVTDSAGKTTQFSVDLTETSDNRSAMQAMAAEINASNTGVRATVVEDKESGTVSMRLDGARTGETEGRFTVTDESAANLGNVSADARNAQYAVNGVDFSSQTNEVKLQEGVTATLNKTGSTQITYQSNTGAAVETVKKFVDTFNSLKDAAAGVAAVTSQLTKTANNFGKALGFSGIGMDAKGNLTVTDEKKLSQSISDGSFAKNFQGVNSFGDRVNSVARDAYRAAYDSAIQENFKSLMNNMNNMNNGMGGRNNSFLSGGDWFNNIASSSGLLLNMLA